MFFFYLDELLHHLGKDLVFLLEFFLQGGDGAIFGSLMGFAAFAGILESGSAVLEEFFLPAVKNSRMKAELIAQIRNGLLFEQMKAKDVHLLRAGIVLAFVAHGLVLRRECCRLLPQRQIPIHAEPIQSRTANLAQTLG